MIILMQRLVELSWPCHVLSLSTKSRFYKSWIVSIEGNIPLLEVLYLEI